MDSNKISNDFGDLFIYEININFQTKLTEIYFGDFVTHESKATKKMIFKNIIWQEFSEFDFTNIFNTIEIEYNFEKFKMKHSEYFTKMKNHISSDTMDEIIDNSNFYYSFRQTCGLNCFVITKNEIIVENLY